jgi:hypothetical protein
MSEVHNPMPSRRESSQNPSSRQTPVDGNPQELLEQPVPGEVPKFRQTIVVSNRQGREEAFTIGPDGQVWSFFPDAAEASGLSGYRLVSLRMPADHVTVGRDASGSLVVIAVKGLQVRYRVENLPADSGAQALIAASRWSSIEYAPLPSITGAMSVQRVYTQEDYGALRVAAIVDLEQSEGGNACALAYCDWNENGPNAFKAVPPLRSFA